MGFYKELQHCRCGYKTRDVGNWWKHRFAFRDHPLFPDITPTEQRVLRGDCETFRVIDVLRQYVRTVRKMERKPTELMLKL